MKGDPWLTQGNGESWEMFKQRRDRSDMAIRKISLQLQGQTGKDELGAEGLRGQILGQELKDGKEMWTRHILEVVPSISRVPSARQSCGVEKCFLLYFKKLCTW